ncbi:putative reverse transcriptase domain-containing protein [Tanacetum coccineum]
MHKLQRFESLAREWQESPNVNTGANQRVCFECGAQGHFKKDCLKLKNNNNGVIRLEMPRLRQKVYAVGNEGQYKQQCRHGSRIVITPTTLDHDYNVELADGRIVGLNTIIRGCTLNFLNHPFNIDLMPVEIVFPEDMPGILPTRQVEFRIDLVPGATPYSHGAHSRLAPSKCKELAAQTKGLTGQRFIRTCSHPGSSGSVCKEER